MQRTPNPGRAVGRGGRGTTGAGLGFALFQVFGDHDVVLPGTLGHERRVSSWRLVGEAITRWGTRNAARIHREGRMAERRQRLCSGGITARFRV